MSALLVCVGWCKFVQVTCVYSLSNLFHFFPHVVGACKFGAACKFSHLTPADKDALMAASKFNQCSSRILLKLLCTYTAYSLWAVYIPVLVGSKNE